MALDRPLSLAPGARVVIRDEEWMVRSIRTATFGGSAVHVVGLSELIRGKEAIFLTDLDEVRELRPEETQLTADDSPRYRRSRLYIESLLRRTPPTDNALCVGHRGAIRRTVYQMQPAARALRLPRPRLLMADGVGLGKTIEAGILLAELIRRGRGERILVVTLKSLLTQFQLELWTRFAIPLVRLDSVGIQRVQSRIPSNMNPFYYFDRVIISIDTLKKDEKYRRYLEASQWDVILVDECQNVAVRVAPGSSRKSQRARLAQLLARTADTLILTSATPHDGRPESFASLINLLEPTAVADEKNYTSEEVKDHFLRRFKKDVAAEVAESFQERRLTLHKEQASPEEDAVFEKLSRLEFRTIQRERRGKGVLFRTVLLKSHLSSPEALIETIEHRLKHEDVTKESDPGAAHDRQVLRELKALAAAIRPEGFSKYRKLLALLRELGFGRGPCRERVVVFSERIATLRFLEKHLRDDLKLEREAIEIFHGSLDDQKQQELVQSFGVESSPVRLLLASDVASEGINLHYFCHRLIHFDLPWSLITMEQRNGRIDRFGQTRPPEITYLLTMPGDTRSKGDLRILERLIEKEEQAHKNLGDVAWLMNLHEAEKEEERIARGIEEGEQPEEIIPEKPRYDDLAEILAGGNPSDEPVPETRALLSLFPDDLSYAREALAAVLPDEPTRVEWHDHLRGFSLRPPEELQRRYDYLPCELQTDGDAIKLTVDRGRVMDSLEAARKDQNGWPEWQLFWELHPIARWLDDRVLAEFARHEAPVLRLARGLGPQDRWFLFSGIISNRRSQPVLSDWFGVGFVGRGFASVKPLPDLIAATGLGTGPPNPGGKLAEAARRELEHLLPAAVGKAAEHMQGLRQHRAEIISAPLVEGLRKLTRWHDKIRQAHEERRRELMRAGRTLSRTDERRLSDAREDAEKRYLEHKRWIEEGMRTVESPYLRLAAVLVPVES